MTRASERLIAALEKEVARLKAENEQLKQWLKADNDRAIARIEQLNTEVRAYKEMNAWARSMTNQ